jgi:hypothetical protein
MDNQPNGGKMKKLSLKILTTLTAALSLTVFAALSYAAMGDNYGNMNGNGSGSGMMSAPGTPGNGNTYMQGNGSGDFNNQQMMGGGQNGNGFSMMGGGGPAMTQNGGFGMMNGLAGAPIVDDDGLAYFVTTNRTNDTSTVPNSNSFTSTILAVNPDGGGVSVNLQGIVSRPVVYGDVLVATASLPDFNNFNMLGNYGQNVPTGQSVLYAFTLPLTETSEPIAVSMDGRFASIPVITNDNIYVTTTDFGRAMLNQFVNDPDDPTLAKTYLYVFNLDGTLVSRTEIQ